MSVAVEARSETVSPVPKDVFQGDDAVRRSRDKFREGPAHCVKNARPKLGTAWDMDEGFVALRDEPYLPRRAVDQQRSDLNVISQRFCDYGACIDMHSSAALRLDRRVVGRQGTFAPKGQAMRNVDARQIDMEMA